MRTGLFFVLRERTWITRRISASRPMTGSSRPSCAARVRSTEYFSRLSYVDSAFSLVTRRLPRMAVRLSSSAFADNACGPSTFWIEPSRASEMRRRSVATYSSLAACADEIASPSTQVSARDADGCWTVAPLALGSAFITCSASRVNASASTPAFATRLRAVPSSWRSSATSRWIGSVWVLPPVVAASCAASMTSRLRVVNFSAPN